MPAMVGLGAWGLGLEERGPGSCRELVLLSSGSLRSTVLFANLTLPVSDSLYGPLNHNHKAPIFHKCDFKALLCM